MIGRRIPPGAGATRGAALVCLLAVGLATAGCNGESEGAEDDTAQPMSVTFVEAEMGEVEEIERALATVETRWAPVIDAEIGGTVRIVEVDVGDEVGNDEVLARIAAADYEIEHDRAVAEVRRLEALAESQDREMTRQRRLRDDGHVSQAAIEAAEAELTARQQELEIARADLESSERDLDRTEVRAPYRGAIAEVVVSEGDRVEAGSPLFEMRRDSTLQIHIPLPETLASRVEKGLEVRLTAASNGDEPAIGRISQIRPDVDAETRALTVIAEVANPGGWQVGSSVNAEVVIDRRESIVVPIQSVVRRPAGSVVYVVDGEIARERLVEIGRRTRAGAEILEGLEIGDQVVVDGAGFLDDGVPVDPSPHEEPASPPQGTSQSGTVPRVRA